MTKQLILFSTSHCHLCDLAVEMVMHVNEPHNLQIIDIADDAYLLELYGLRIPVLRRLDTKAELNWPFSIESLNIFLQ
jgi:hypothetical protein